MQAIEEVKGRCKFVADGIAKAVFGRADLRVGRKSNNPTIQQSNNPTLFHGTELALCEEL